MRGLPTGSPMMMRVMSQRPLPIRQTSTNWQNYALAFVNRFWRRPCLMPHALRAILRTPYGVCGTRLVAILGGTATAIRAMLIATKVRDDRRLEDRSL